MIEIDVAMELRMTHQKMAQVMREKIDEYGLTFRLLHILMRIDKNPDVNQKELSKDMKLTQGAVSGSVKRLIKLNMLQQIPLEEDMRYNKLVITESAREIIDDYQEHVNVRYKDIFLGFDYEELVGFGSLLAKINNNLDEINKDDTNI